MPVEFAVSKGPGTLYDYGVADGVGVGDRGASVYDERPDVDAIYPPRFLDNGKPVGITFIVAACSDDCPTGK